jgi:hypothetical protein
VDTGAPPKGWPELPTNDDIVVSYESSPPNVQKTRSLAAGLDSRLKKDSFAKSDIKVDAVECRGASCRAQVSFADTAPVESIVMEVAAALPDSHSFQEAAAAGDHRRKITSYYTDEAKDPGHP